MSRPAAWLLGALFAGLALGAPGPALPQDCGERGDVAVQVLGSGGPIADDARASAAYLVWVEGSSLALIDAGGGAFLRFGEAGARFEALDFIGLSHFHTDHSADFPALLKSGYFSSRSRPLTVAGPGAGGPFPGLQTYLTGLLNPEDGAYGYLSGYLDGSGGLARLVPVEVPAGADGAVALEASGGSALRVDAMHVPHGIVPALAFRLTVADTVIVFGSDQNGDDPEFANFARDADLLVMHMAISQGAGEAARRLHATPDEIGRLAASAQAKALLLSHFMARSLRTLDDNLARVRAGFDGPVFVASDLGCYLPRSRQAAVIRRARRAPGSQVAQVLDDAPAGRPVGQAAESGADVVRRMARVGRLRQHAGDRRMREDELERKLRPALAVELRGPARQVVAANPVEVGAVDERPIDGDRDAMIGGRRQDPLLGLGFKGRIIDLQDVDRSGRHQVDHGVVVAAAVAGDTDVAGQPLVLPLPEH